MSGALATCDTVLEHPEFFRVNPEDEKASPVWRKQHLKRYDPRRARSGGAPAR